LKRPGIERSADGLVRVNSRQCSWNRSIRESTNKESSRLGVFTALLSASDMKPAFATSLPAFQVHRAFCHWASCARLVAALALLVAGTARNAVAQDRAATSALPDPLYETRPGTPDGISKWFLGREIAHYMSHQGAMWLEREEREEEEQPSELLKALKLEPGQVIADIGAGSGYFSWRMAKLVGPSGKVFANDIQPEMLAILRTNVAARGVTNVIPILGSVTNVNLPANSVDLALFVDVYHECDHPYEIIQSLCHAVKPGGRIVFVEYRGEEKWIPIKPLHKMTEAQVLKEMTLHPLRHVETLRLLPRQHVIVFQRIVRPTTFPTK
jgi:ubiquinone/menaquinone biosynthesis C-methylase UbiE